MSNRLAIYDSATCGIVRSANQQVADIFRPKGHFVTEHWRENQLIGVYEAPNLIVNEAKNRLFNTIFNAAATYARYETWYLGLMVLLQSFSAHIPRQALSGWNYHRLVTQVCCDKKLTNSYLPKS